MPTQPESRAKRKATGIITKARTRAAHRAPKAGLGAAAWVEQFIDKSGVIDAERLAASLRMTKRQLAVTAGLELGAMDHAERRVNSGVQSRLREMLVILSRVRLWAGGELQALAWYCTEPIPALDGRTPEALVKAGEGGAVRDYLDQLAVGGFA